MDSKAKVDKKTFWEHVKSTNGKIIITLGIFIGLQEILPIVKDILGLTADNKAIVEECKLYTDSKIEEEKDKGRKVFDVLVEDVYELQQKHNSRTFAVGLRADKDGIMHYRSKNGNECPVRLNHTTHGIEFRSKVRDIWLPILIEDLDL